MAVIHISEEEAAQDFSAVVARVRAGDDVQIGSVATLTHTVASVPKGRPIAEILKSMEEHGDTETRLDDQFGADMEAIYKTYEHERPRDPWESF